MSKSDYYETLGVQKNATDEQIKKAYRKKAMKYHPDRNRDDAKAEERFKEVNKAYEVLSDRQKRAAYDQFGHAGVDGEAGGAGGFGGFGKGAGGFSDIGDIFENIFNAAGGGSARSHQGADLLYQLDIDLEDAIFGKSVSIQVPNWVSCSPCGGSGAKKGTQPSTCSTCHGTGQARIQQGFFATGVL